MQISHQRCFNANENHAIIRSFPSVRSRRPVLPSLVLPVAVYPRGPARAIAPNCFRNPPGSAAANGTRCTRRHRTPKFCPSVIDMSQPRIAHTAVAALALALTATTVLANPVSLVEKRASPVWEGGYYNPTSNGGQWLTVRTSSPSFVLRVPDREPSRILIPNA